MKLDQIIIPQTKVRRIFIENLTSGIWVEGKECGAVINVKPEQDMNLPTKKKKKNSLSYQVLSKK